MLENQLIQHKESSYKPTDLGAKNVEVRLRVGSDRSCDNCCEDGDDVDTSNYPKETEHSPSHGLWRTVTIPKNRPIADADILLI